MRQLILTVITLLLATLVMDAQPSNQTDKLRNEALDLFDSKQFVEAYPLYSQLVSLFPQDGDLNFRFGVCTLYSGESKEDAIKHLTFAKKKRVADPRLFYYLGKAYHLNYEFDLAISFYQQYLDKKDPKSKEVLPAQQGITMCSQGKNLLTNIKDVVVLDKTSADVEAFFRFYNLEEIGGKILAIPDVLKSKYDKKQGYNGVLYRNTSSSTVYYSSYGKDGSNGLDIYKTFILPDGTFSKSELLGDEINTPEDEEFAYMHADGTSFYFASKGHNSMGGYDIFKSNFNGANFTSPQNMDFAINTPDDDLFFVTDSAHRTAYFASARSSKQGELHVYKVMVDGIPIQLMFVQGVFANEVKSNEQKARLKIIDELSGKTIIDTYTDQVKGDYLLSFPKSGRYKLELQVQGNSVIHEGVIDLPSFDHPVALKQELKLINDGGRDQLIIENYFEEELDVNLAELSASALKQKASLEVNATEELIAEAENQGNNSLEVGIDEAHLAAGFNADKPVDVILSEMSDQITENKQRKIQLGSLAARSVQQADSFYLSAKTKTDQAEQLLSNADKTGQNSYLEALKEYNRLLIASQDDQVKSTDLFESAKLLNKAQEEHDQKTASIEQAQTEIQQALDEKDTESLIALLQTEKENRRTPFDPLKASIAEEKELSLEIENDVQNYEDRLVSLRADEKQLASSIERKKENIQQATKKNVKIQLQEELTQEEAELLYVKNEIVKADNYISKQSRIGVGHSNRSEILSNLVNNDEEIEPLAPVENDQITQRLADLSKQQNRNEVLMLDNSEALTSLSEETKQTRNDIVRLENIKSASVSTGIDWKDLKEIKANYSEKVLLLSESPQVKTIKEKVLLEKAETEVYDQLRLLQTAQKIDNTAEIGLAIEELEVYQNELQNRKQDLAAEFTASDDSDQIAPSELQEKFNSVTDESDPFAFAKEGKKLEMELLELKASNQDQILESDDEQDLQRLAQENQWINERLADLNSKSNEESNLDAFELAYNDQKEDLMKSDLSQQDRTNELMNLSNNMVELLEEKKETEGLTQEEEIRLAKERNQLDAYSEDLLMLVSVSEPLAENKVDILPAEELAIINEIYPNYTEEFDQVNNGDYTQELEQIEDQMELNSALAAVTQAKIDERVDAIDLSSDEEEKERLQLEITKLQSIVNRTANERLSLSERKSDLASFTSDVTPDLGEESNPLSDNSTSSSSEEFAGENTNDDSELVANTTPAAASTKAKKALYSEVQLLLEDEQSTSVNDAYDHKEFLNLEALIDDDRFDKDVEEVRMKSVEITSLESEMELADSEGKKRKIDKKIEKAFYDRSSSEIRISKQTAEVSKEVYESNLLALDVLKNQKEEIIAENPGLLTRLNEVDQESSEAFEEAAALRKAAEPEIDEIKQADSYKRAALLEMQALEQQREAIALLSKSEQLADFSEEEKEALFSFQPFPVDENSSTEDLVVLNPGDGSEELEMPVDDSRVEVSENELNVDQPEGNNDSAENTTPDATSTVNEEAFLAVEDNSENDLSTTENAALEAEVENAEELLAIENEIKEEFELPNALKLESNESLDETSFASEKEISSTEFERVKASVAYAKVIEIDDEISELEASKMTSLERRAALVDQIQSQRAKLINLSQAANQSESEAEKEGLSIEIENIRAKASVNYATLASLDEEIKEKNENLNNAIEKRNNFLIDLDVAEIIAEGAEVSTPASPEVSIVAVAPISPELAVAKSEGYFFAKESVNESFNFSFPEELTEEVFSIVDETPYSAGQPIPIGLEMPKGVIYKVQVGAFRNAIPQNLYGNFTPISGELTNSGLTRYTVGLFKAFATADLAKTEVNTMGYKDAFVVAYRDGVRIPLYEARGETDAGVDAQAIAKAKDEIQRGEESSTNAQELAESIDSREIGSPESENSDVLATVAENTTSENESNFSAEQDWSQQTGSYYTVQVGVFSKRISASEIGLEGQLMVEELDNGYFRYSSGKYGNIGEARGHQGTTRQSGVQDAFVTAYKNGKRVSVSSISSDETTPTPVPSNEPIEEPKPIAETTATPSGVYRVVIGTFNGEVPSKTAIMLLQLESEYGIVQEITDNGTRYISKKVSSEAEAQKIADAFADGGVQIQTIQKLPE